MYGGKDCPAVSATEACNAHPCPVDCVVGEYSTWSTCSTSCGEGFRRRHRFANIPAANGGKPCPTLVQITRCDVKICPIDCQVTAWSAWSQCTKSCSGGQQLRTRSIIHRPTFDGKECGLLAATQSCNAFNCPVDCSLTEFSSWSTCSKTCGGGHHSRVRKIISSDSYGGAKCGALKESAACNSFNCGCSHTYCSLLKHEVLNKMSIRVHHHNREQGGNKHLCKYDHATNKCECQCVDDESDYLQKSREAMQNLAE